jgi:hypothetical protein
MNPAAKQESLTPKGKEAPFHLGQTKEIAPGIILFAGSWNTTLIKQDDGLIVLECPISDKYVAGFLEESKREFPNAPVKAVLSTSDSWPHVGGIRQAVAEGIPVYILDLNQPLLEKMITASHTLSPDQLSRSPKEPVWHLVSHEVTIGNGKNRIELHPLRGFSTERQYLVYFPEHKLLYASDTLLLHDDGGLYDPELMYEVLQVVEQHHLEVNTVYSMHQGPIPWSEVLSLITANTQVRIAHPN